MNNYLVNVGSCGLNIVVSTNRRVLQMSVRCALSYHLWRFVVRLLKLPLLHVALGANRGGF